MSLLAAHPHLRRWTLCDPVPVKHPATTGLPVNATRQSGSHVTRQRRRRRDATKEKSPENAGTLFMCCLLGVRSTLVAPVPCSLCCIKLSHCHLNCLFCMPSHRLYYELPSVLPSVLPAGSFVPSTLYGQNGRGGMNRGCDSCAYSEEPINSAKRRDASPLLLLKRYRHLRNCHYFDAFL